MKTFKSGFAMVACDDESFNNCQTVLDFLNKLSGDEVSTYVTPSDKRTDFIGISINGSLENLNGDQFRVLRNDGTYAYFSSRHVKKLGVRKHNFQDGSKAAIQLDYSYRRRRSRQ